MEINFSLNSNRFGTWNHTAGVLGLLQSLEAIEVDNPYSFAWNYDDRNLNIGWRGNSFEAWDWLIRQTFQLIDGIITLPGNRIHGHAHMGMLETVLQVPATRPMESPIKLEIKVQENVCEFNTLKLKSYIHSSFAKKLGKKRTVVTSWLLPNCTMTHPDSPQLNWTEDDIGAIALLFSHTVTGHYFVYTASSNGKFFRTTALCTPIVYSLKQRVKFEFALFDVYAGSLADAAYRYAQINECGIHAYEFKSESANRPAKIINALEVFPDRIEEYTKIRENFPNNCREDEDSKIRFYPNFVRGYIARNIALNKSWFEGIAEQTSNLHPKRLVYNRGNLNKTFFQ